MMAIILRNVLTLFNLLNAAIISGLFVLFFVFDDRRLILDSISVMLVVLVNTLVSIIQEWRAKRALDSVVLEQHRTASVIRDDKEITIDRDDVALDDIVVVRRGSLIVVDGIVTEAVHLEIEDSFITGESAPSIVGVGDEVLSGSACVAGYGAYRATRIGRDHTVAQIADLSRRYQFTPSPLQRSINRIFEFSFFAALVLAGIDILFHVTELADVDLVRRVATLLLGLIPESLVFFTTITFTLGVYRISKLGVYVQKLNAVESFATVDTVCMDKTGTITENRLTVHRVIPMVEGGSDIRPLMKTYALTTDDADQVTAALASLAVESADQEWLTTIPFSSERKWSARQLATGEWAVLGAPEMLLGNHDLVSYRELVAAHRLEPYRLLAFGFAHTVTVGTVPTIKPICVVALADAVRPESARTFDLFEASNIDVRILTGDAPGAVIAALQAIGRDVDVSDVVLGSELDAMTDEERVEATLQFKVFSRLKPDQKREIIRTLQHQHKHVAMVGDGVNDLPAIKEAHVGIAVAKSADATKEVADIVLERQTFDVFPDIVREGRTTIRTVLIVAELYIGKNLMLLALSALNAFTSIPYPLTPRRGALLSVVGVGIPAVLLASTSRINQPVQRFIRTLLTFAIYTTVLSLVVAIAAWITFGLVLGWQESELIECMFAGLIGLLLGTFVEADTYERRVYRLLLLLAVALGISFILLALAPYLPFPFELIREFYEIDPVAWSTAIGMAWSISIGMVTAMAVHRIRRLLSV